jgi:hypothetical protein
MLAEKDPQAAYSETCIQDGDKIGEGGDVRYPIELKKSSDTSDTEAALTFDPNSEEIKKVRWKVDKRFIPLLAIMYLCSYLDRASIGMFLRFVLSFLTANVLSACGGCGRGCM